MAVVFTVFTNCEKKDPPVALDTIYTIVPADPADTLDPGSSTGDALAHPPPAWYTLQPGPFLEVWSKSCTGSVIGFLAPNEYANCRTMKGVCVATDTNPTTSDILGYTEDRGIRIGDKNYNSMSCVDGLQPATTYYARAWYTLGDSTFYSERMSFSTNPKPEITTGEVSELTATTAMIGGNNTSTGGSFVVERGICYSRTNTCPDHPYVNVQYIEQEVQSTYATGAFKLQLTGLAPGKLYYARAFVGVATGIEYGDQLFAFGDVITFVTK